MTLDLGSRLTVRDAVAADVPALTAIKGPHTEALHYDRLRDAQGLSDAQGPDLRYLVLVEGEDVIGFCLLVTRRPAHWSDSDDSRHLPQLVDLQVKEACRGRGCGSAFMRAIEQFAAQAGHTQLFLCVEPLDNPRAHALYLRLGYRALQAEPHLERWQFTDLEGVSHSGDLWVVDMVKDL